jgi:hypothetical protein
MNFSSFRGVRSTSPESILPVVVMDFGPIAEPVIGPRFARTRW